MREQPGKVLSSALLNFSTRTHLGTALLRTAGATEAYRPHVERDAAMAALPDVYRTALELRERGAAHADIASALDVDVSAIGALLAIGDEKLARLLAPGV